MDREEIKGRTEKLKGDVKETVGKATGNEKLEAEGKADQFEGGVREGFGKAREGLKEAKEDIREAFNDARKDDEPRP